MTPDSLHLCAMALCHLADCSPSDEVKRHALRRAWRLEAKAARLQIRGVHPAQGGAWWASVLYESAAWCAVQAGAVRTAWALVDDGRRVVDALPESRWRCARVVRLDALTRAIEDLEWAPMEAAE